MASNPIKQTLDSLFEHLNPVNGLLFHLYSQLKNFHQLFQRSFDESNFAISHTGAGARLVIRDITVMPKGDFYPLKGFVTRGEEYLELTDTLLHRNAAWAVAQGYEIFETFLYDVVAYLLLQEPGKAEINKLQNFDKKKGAGRTKDISYWKEYVRWAYRGKQNREIFKYLRKLAPSIEGVETNNALGFELNEWYSTVTEVRNAVTHTDLMIPIKNLQGWSPERKDLLEEHFPGSWASDSYILGINHKKAEKVLIHFAEYGYILFKELSRACGYEWRVFPLQFP
jgi:hypothetical protein